jgi:hypothetical protein
MPAMTPDLDRARIKLKRIRPKKWAEFSLGRTYAMDLLGSSGHCTESEKLQYR